MASGTIVCVIHNDQDGARNRYNYNGVISNLWDQYNQRLVPNAGNLADWKYEKPSGKADGNWIDTAKNITQDPGGIIVGDGAGGGTSTCINGTYIRTIRTGAGNQRYLGSEIQGFALDWKYSRDGNNSIMPYKFGAWFENESGSRWVWSGNEVAKGKKETWYRYSGDFDSITLGKLRNNGYALKYIIASIGSGRLGTGGACRTSYTYLKNLRFKWASINGQKMLLPAIRSSPFPRYYNN